MWTTQRRDRRTRRRAGLQLECLDDRLVLSAGAGGAAAVHHHHHHAAVHHAAVHHAAMAAHGAMASTTSASQAIIAGSGPVSASGRGISVSASGHTRGHITITPGSGMHPELAAGSGGPRFQMTTVSTGSSTGGSTSTTTDATTTPGATTPTGHLPGHLITGPNGQPIAAVF